jgi:hypothetical protein
MLILALVQHHHCSTMENNLLEPSAPNEMKQGISGGYNNCHVAGSMTGEQWDRSMEKYYNSLPMTKEREEWMALVAATQPSEGTAKKPRKKAAKKK